MPRTMKSAGAALLVLLLAAGCKSASSGPADYARAVLQAPVASTGSGINPDAMDSSSPTGTEAKAAPPSKIFTANGMQVKEILVDPRDAKARIDFLRTLLGEDWLLAGKTMQSGGVVVYRFIRRDIFRVESDPFGLPDLTGSPKDIAGSKPK
jgi:hypothetical protein